MTIYHWTGPKNMGFVTWVLVLNDYDALAWIESEQEFRIVTPPPVGAHGGYWEREQMFAEGEAQHASRVL